MYVHRDAPDQPAVQGIEMCLILYIYTPKVDLIEAYGELDFNLDFYTDVLDPVRLPAHPDPACLSTHVMCGNATCHITAHETRVSTHE